MGGATLPLAELYSPIQDDLTVVERLFDRELSSDLACVDQLCRHIRAYRGKMLRPALLLLSARASGVVTPEHHTLGAVVEMVHMASLVHDDVLDEASERRRQVTVNAVSGNVAAVLLGDCLFSHAFHLCSKLDSQDASRLIGATTHTICEGELLQNHQRGRARLSEEEYLDIVRRKTAALTATCCQLGALFAGADIGVVRALEAYGMSAGIAFQVIDDVLDIVGEPLRVGKTLGRDFDLGKATLPTIHCLAHSNPREVDRLVALLQVQNGGTEVHEELCSLLEQTESIEYAVSVAREYMNDAASRLECLPPSDAKASLGATAEFIVGRRF